MKERPILFSAPMVRAILEGIKTQTRRIITRPLQHPGWTEYRYFGPSKNDPACRSMAIECGPDYPDDNSDQVPCPYGAVGDRIWVRETHCPIWPQDPNYNVGKPIEMDYRATPTERMCDSMGVRKWTPAIHMRREYSRITLEVTGVRVERLQNISETDAQAEGVERCATHRVSYIALWNTINGAGSWESNPWVWVIEFKRVTE